MLRTLLVSWSGGDDPARTGRFDPEGSGPREGELVCFPIGTQTSPHYRAFVGRFLLVDGHELVNNGSNASCVL